MKRIVTMQDISCVGKCSLTVALPVISSMGVEASVIPTAVLSTHTMFSGFSFDDLTSQIHPILDHWSKEGFTFDGIYTGYLGSFEQLSLAKELFTRFKPTGPILVDPCMADNGKLYVGFDTAFADAMATLCGQADIICPNLTEASFLLHEPYQPSGYTEAEIRRTCERLSKLGCRTVVLTGVSLREGRLGAYAYDSFTNEHVYTDTVEQREHFHGTGDLWASCFFAGLIRGLSLSDSLQLASDFVCNSISLTLKDPHHRSYGVHFEQAIPEMLQALNKILG